MRAIALGGVAEADETYTLRPYKGQRRRLRAEQARAPCRRGGKAAKRGLSAEQVPVLVLRDRSGQTADFVLEHADARHIGPVLAQTLADDAVLCTDASAALAAAASARQLEHQAVNIARGERRRGPWHIQNVNAYHSRWKTWMAGRSHQAPLIFTQANMLPFLAQFAPHQPFRSLLRRPA